MRKGEKIALVVAGVFLLAELGLHLGNRKDTAATMVSIESADTLNAYSGDSVRKDTAVIRTDTLKKKTILLPNAIDTKNATPEAVIAFAQTLIGVPYQYASTDPKTGFDCSGFITYVFKHFDVIVPRSSIDFTHVGRTIPADSAKQADIILFTGTDSTEKFVGHMGLIVSNANGEINFIHSTSGKKHGVTITPLNGYYKGRYVKTIRIFPQNEEGKP